VIRKGNGRRYVGPYELSYEDRVRLNRDRKWAQLSPSLRELAAYVELLTELYGFKECQR
jgi:hypothetical protein